MCLYIRYVDVPCFRTCRYKHDEFIMFIFAFTHTVVCKVLGTPGQITCFIEFSCVKQKDNPRTPERKSQKVTPA